jgi:hypothetical protein
MCYVHQLKRNALDGWRHDMLIWASIAPQLKEKLQRPPVPRILRPNNAD